METNIWYQLKTKSLGFAINTLGYFFPQQSSKLAYKFFSQPREGKINPSQLPPVLLQAERSSIDTGDHNIETYVWKGNDKKILFIHGWESNSSRWGDLVQKLLQTKATLISIDAPAQGLSSGVELNVIDYAKQMDTIINMYQPQVLIGHSMGGAACMYYQTKYAATCVEQMVIMGAPAEFNSLGNYYKNLVGMSNKSYERFLTFIENRFKLPKNQAIKTIFASNFTAKGLIIHDAQDHIVHPEQAKKLNTIWKNSELFQTDGLGHALQGDPIFEKIFQFISQA